MNAWRADPLVWGHGPRVFEVFLEPVMSAPPRRFSKLLRADGRGGLTSPIRMRSLRLGPPPLAAQLRWRSAAERLPLSRPRAAVLLAWGIPSC
jgi:hypothetical protein